MFSPTVILFHDEIIYSVTRRQTSTYPRHYWCTRVFGQYQHVEDISASATTTATAAATATAAIVFATQLQRQTAQRRRPDFGRCCGSCGV